MCRTIAALLVIAATAAAAAQSPTFSASREAVRVDVLVSARGRPIAGLQPSDFAISDNGRPQQVDLATFEELPIDLVLTLDMSGSVAGTRLEHLRQAGRGVLKALKPRDRASLVTFSHVVARRVPLTTDLAAVRTALDAAEGSGETALVDGIYASIALGAGEAGRGLIIVFSDGMDTASWLSPDALLDTAKRSNVVVYVVSAGDRHAPPLLGELAAATGGSLLTVSSTARLEAAFLQILEEYRHRYVVSYSPVGADEAGWHRLEVRVPGRQATVRARPGYYRTP